MLRLDRTAERLVLAEVGGLPCALEQVESEIAPERVFDYFAMTPAAAGCLDPDSAQDAFVQSDRGSHLRHISVIASSRTSHSREAARLARKGSNRKV
jgi:sugar/nucleoside kinase (ribokinase family)